MLMKIAIIMAIVSGGYVLIDYFILAKRRKELGKEIKILLFEKVGKDKVFKGVYRGSEENDEQIGLHIIIGKLKRAISVANEKDYFPDAQFGRCLMVCKYSDDDYRSMSRMNNEEWYQKIQLPFEDVYETEEEENDKGEMVKKLKIDENGEYIPKVDEDGEPLIDYEMKKYEEPIGVNQSSREAMRFNRAFAKRMQDKRKSNEGFWDKYGQQIVTAFVILLMFMGNAYAINKVSTVQEQALDKFSEEADKIVKSIQSKTFAESLYQKMQERTQPQPTPNK